MGPIRRVATVCLVDRNCGKRLLRLHYEADGEARWAAALMVLQEEAITLADRGQRMGRFSKASPIIRNLRTAQHGEGQIVAMVEAVAQIRKASLWWTMLTPRMEWWRTILTSASRTTAMFRHRQGWMRRGDGAGAGAEIGAALEGEAMAAVGEEAEARCWPVDLTIYVKGTRRGERCVKARRVGREDGRGSDWIGSRSLLTEVWTTNSLALAI